ncbi:MAG: DUF2948 family protein [Bdellovibrionales bacterium]|jgi:hypothetical protein
MTDEPLKLMARDAEDIQVMAAVLQDAIAPTCDMVYHPVEKNFVMVVQRFKWDGVQDGAPIIPLPANEEEACSFERINCALDIDGVEAVQFTGINPNDPAAMLDLLTISYEAPYLQFLFAGEGRMRLKLADWGLKLRDFGESWPTTHCPRHAT